MSKFPETRALAEQALRHVLDLQAKLLKRKDAAEMIEIVAALNNLAVKTSNLLVEGFNRSQPLHEFTDEAKAVEKLTDDASKKLWKFIEVSVSAIYEKMENSVRPREGEWGLAAETRAHYHNLRLRLLEQLLGARMLAQNSDLGDESERVWVQFLERQVGASLRVLRGGQIYDHEGNRSSQIDLIVVPADAQIFLPGDTDDGKAHVLVDQVVAAIMVTTNLTTEKLKKDWQSVQTIPAYKEMEKDFSFKKGHPWPLCYIVAAQSDPIEKLKSAWVEMCKAGHTKVVPQFVITLDTGFIYGGWRSWPSPHFPSNYTEVDEVHEVTGIYAGLGLAWLILQQQGRIAAMRHHVLKPISRFAEILNKAAMKEGVPATWSHRFNTMLLPRKIGGIFEWGGTSFFAHNDLHLMSLSRHREGAETIYETDLHIEGMDLKSLEWNTHHQFLRWFRYPAALTRGRVLAIEEWVNPRSKEEHARKIAVFDLETGNEIKCPYVDSLTNFPDLEKLEAEVSCFISPSAQKKEKNIPEAAGE